MTESDIKKIVESLIQTFLDAGKISIDLRKKGLTKEIKSKDDFFNELSNLGSSFKKNLYILCHGSAGRLFFGGDFIDTNTLLEKSSILKTLSIENILLYSCKVGQDKSFINSLKSLKFH